MHHRSRPFSYRSFSSGFTLVEILMSAVILAVGVVSVMGAMGAGTNMNTEAVRLTRAAYLAEQIREWTLRVPFLDPDTGTRTVGDDGSSPDGENPFVDDLNDLYVAGGLEYAPPVIAPIGSNWQYPTYMDEMDDWSQIIYLEWREMANPTQVDSTKTSDLVYVTVDITYQGETVLTTGWLVRNDD